MPQTVLSFTCKSGLPTTRRVPSHGTPVYKHTAQESLGQAHRTNKKVTPVGIPVGLFVSGEGVPFRAHRRETRSGRHSGPQFRPQSPSGSCGPKPPPRGAAPALLPCPPEPQGSLLPPHTAATSSAGRPALGRGGGRHQLGRCPVLLTPHGLSAGRCPGALRAEGAEGHPGL